MTNSMGLHKLYIFAKNRDAIAAQKGYTFQQLKTLEDWIENRIVGGDEEIYCDYEDDILSRDIAQGRTKFKQIKLYSTDFSFSSEGLKTAIAHFFSMYVKGEYSFDQTEFFFETNASIADKTVRDNDADLLREWFQNQDNIGPELLDRIRVRVKKILAEYLAERVASLSRDVSLKSDLQIAQNIYNNLKDEDFDAFARCIKWQFDGIDVNAAIEQILSRINDLIPKIPLPLDDEKISTYSALLIAQVYNRSIQDDPEDRKLTKDLLDAVLLNAGEKKDQWYAETFQQLKSSNPIRHFFPGEFQTIVNAANYSRGNEMDHGHVSLWLSLLQQYFNLAETPKPYKRKAIYEYLFLKIIHNFRRPGAESPIANDSDLINYYFENWAPGSRLQDMEDDIVLLQLVKSQVKSFGLSFSLELLLKWQDEIRTYLERQVENESVIDRICELIELQGHLAQQSDIENRIESYKSAFSYYRKIPPLLEKAQYYSLSRLYAQMNELVKMLTRYGLNDELIEMLDLFMNEIQPYAEKTGLRHKTAHELAERGILHIGRHDFPNYLKALTLFHRAKSLWRLEYTKEGYILALLGLAQVYLGLGMSYASKYYALCAFWVTWHFADSKLYKRLQEALCLIQHLDYKHGAWISAITDFRHYLFTKREFDERGFEISDDERYHTAVFEMAAVIQAAPIIRPEMAAYIDSVKAELGFVWMEQIQPAVESITEKVQDLDGLKGILSYKLLDLPLNDVGATRNIRFNALGSAWHIQFDNTLALTPIGEEFVNFLQIALTEIARSDSGVLRSGKRMLITVQEGHFQKEPIGTDEWIVTIPPFDSKEQPDIQMHYSYIGALVMAILQSISPLSKSEFRNFYLDHLLAKEEFGDKALAAASYQRIFRNTIGGSSKTYEERKTFKAIDDSEIRIIYPNWLLSTKG